MRVVVEFQGVARVAAGTKEVELELAEGTTYRDIVRLLGERYPGLVGTIIHAEGTSFDASVLDQATKRVIPEDRMSECPRDGDRITLMSILAGG
jgi:molybdopterin converting factor small subunit